MGCSPAIAPAQEKTDAATGLRTWSIRTYRYPADELTSGFPTRDRGQLRAPALPPTDVKESDAIAFIERSTDIMDAFLKEQGATFPAGTLFAFDRASQTLAVRSTGEAHGVMNTMAEDMRKRSPQYLVFTLQVVEAEAEAVRVAVKEAAKKADHTAILTQLEGFVAGGRAKRLDMLRLETRSGQRATVTSAQAMQYPTTLTMDEKGRSEVAQEQRFVGTKLEIDPVIGPDGMTMDVNYAVDYHFAPPTQRWEAAAITGPRRLETRAIDFHTATMRSATTLFSGFTKLLGTWAPEGAQGAEAPRRLQLAFLRGTIVSVLPAQNNRVEQMLTSLGEKVLATPKEAPPEARKAPSALPAGMEVRRYRVPADFLARDPANYSAPAAPADPFAAGGGAAAEPKIAVRMTALNILQARGIPFPEGSSASFIPATSELVVRNTPENLQKLEAFLESIRDRAPLTVGLVFYVVQGDAAAMRQIEADTANIADHTEVWGKVEAEAAQGRIKIVRTTWIETRSGQRATFEGGEEHVYFKGMKVAAFNTPEFSPTFKPEHEMELVGTRMEVDPVIGPDNRTLDLNFSLEHDTAAPTLHQEAPAADENVVRVDAAGTDFHQAQLTTAVTLTTGMTRMLGIWKPDAPPEGANAEVLQAAFVKADLIKMEKEAK
jgi:hypothetical protein